MERWVKRVEELVKCYYGWNDLIVMLQIEWKEWRGVGMVLLITQFRKPLPFGKLLKGSMLWGYARARSCEYYFHKLNKLKSLKIEISIARVFSRCYYLRHKQWKHSSGSEIMKISEYWWLVFLFEYFKAYSYECKKMEILRKRVVLKFYQIMREYEYGV